MVTAGRLAPVSVARAYFALQAVGGAVWWIAVAASDDVRAWTLGQWSPAVLGWPDLALFVGASAITAVWGSRTSAVVAAVWTTGHDPSDARPIAALARSLEIDPEELSRQEIKDALKMGTEHAIGRGVFGVPTLDVGGELFWGADSTDFVKAFLADPSILSTAEMQRLAALPVSASRIPL